MPEIFNSYAGIVPLSMYQTASRETLGYSPGKLVNPVVERLNTCRQVFPKWRIITWWALPSVGPRDRDSGSTRRPESNIVIGRRTPLCFT